MFFFFRLFLLRGADTSIRNKENKLPMDVRMLILTDFNLEVTYNQPSSASFGLHETME